MAKLLVRYRKSQITRVHHGPSAKTILQEKELVKYKTKKRIIQQISNLHFSNFLRNINRGICKTWSENLA
jgi:hypothetical protein